MARGQSRKYNKQRTVGPAKAWGNRQAQGRRVPTGETVVRPDGSSIKMMKTRSTSTPGQKERFRTAAGNNAALRGANFVSRNPNAADVSMNNSPMWKDSSGHAWNPRTGRQLPHKGHSQVGHPADSRNYK